MAESARIEELRRRVETDPASIAFAQLAEEYRRAGEYEEALRVSRAGLARHPGYLSARVTLGRTLLELQQYDEAQAELEQVLNAAPDNLAAIRGLAEIYQRRGEVDPTPDVELTPPAALPEDDAVANEFDEALRALDALVLDLPEPVTDGPAEAGSYGREESDPVLAELEGWLTAIRADREARRGGSKK